MKPYIFLVFLSFYLATSFCEKKGASAARNYGETMENHQVLRRVSIVHSLVNYRFVNLENSK